MKASAVISASGLRTNSEVSRADLDAAAQALISTGLFSGVNYRYDPRGGGAGDGYTVTLVVNEEPAREGVVIDVPGIDAEQIWNQAGDDSLIDRVITAQPAATDYYVHQIESLLSKGGHSERLTTHEESDLKTRQRTLVIQPLDRPIVVDAQFDGNKAVATQLIRERTLQVTANNPFSERDFRRVLEWNIRPMFEEKGCLQVKFKQIQAVTAGTGKVSVATVIEDGPTWRLGKITLEGENLPADRMLAAGKFATGEVANWKAFLAGLENMNTVLKREGFLKIQSNPVRAFNAESGIVDVTVQVNKGPQYHFASLNLSGLPEPERNTALRLWRLQPGEPMDGLYVTEYLNTLRPKLSNAFSGKKISYSWSMQVHPGTNDVDVVLAFK